MQFGSLSFSIRQPLNVHAASLLVSQERGASTTPCSRRRGRRLPLARALALVAGYTRPSPLTSSSLSFRPSLPRPSSPHHTPRPSPLAPRLWLCRRPPRTDGRRKSSQTYLLKSSRVSQTYSLKIYSATLLFIAAVVVVVVVVVVVHHCSAPHRSTPHRPTPAQFVHYLTRNSQVTDMIAAADGHNHKVV